MRFEVELPWGNLLVYGIDGIKWFGELFDPGRDRLLDNYRKLAPQCDPTEPARELMLWVGRASELYDEADFNRFLAAFLFDDHSGLGQHFGFLFEVVVNLNAALGREELSTFKAQRY